MSTVGLLVFRTNSATIRAEKLLRNASLEARVIPDPRQTVAACGIALRFPWEQRDAAQQLVRDARLDVVALLQFDASVFASDDSLPSARHDSC
jgi:hypothetical protein